MPFEDLYLMCKKYFDLKFDNMAGRQRKDQSHLRVRTEEGRVNNYCMFRGLVRVGVNKRMRYGGGHRRV